MINTDALESGLKLLDAVFAAGINTFDTAHVYGTGECERGVGRWVNSRGLREQVVIIGKGAHPNRDRKRVTPFDISSDIHDSLARFQFDYIDLYLLHRDDPNVPVGPIVERLNEHKEAGHIRAYGGSNWTPERIAQANAYADLHGLAPFVASSPNFSLAEQAKPPWDGCITISGTDQKASREWYKAKQMPLFTWSSLAGGFFSGRFTPENLETFEPYLDQLCVEVYCYGDNWHRLDRVKEMAVEKNATISQIALAYVLNQSLNIFAIAACYNEDEIMQNVAASEIELTPSEIRWLEEGK